MVAGLIMAAGLCGCSGILPVPGGDEQINSKIYKSPDDFKSRVDSLEIGMSRTLVMAKLNCKETNMTRLSRQDLVASLYGGANSGFDGTYEEQEKARAFLEKLTGFKLEYVDTEREHGFTSPIRIKTHEDGYKFTLYLVFQDDRLFSKPVLSGGQVNGYTSKTIFDYLNPGTLFGIH